MKKLKSGHEIEKKILLKKLPKITFDEIQNITQYYTPKGRFRSVHTVKGIKFIKTIKKHITIGVNDEQEWELTQAEFNKAIKTATRKIIKTRFIKKTKTVKWEIDVFAFIKLIIAEVEVKNQKQLSSIKLPKFIKNEMILDVTGIKALNNFSLAEEL